MWTQSPRSSLVRDAFLAAEDDGSDLVKRYDTDDKIGRFNFEVYLHGVAIFTLNVNFREFMEFKRILRRFKDCVKTGDGIRAKKSYEQF